LKIVLLSVLVIVLLLLAGAYIWFYLGAIRMKPRAGISKPEWIKPYLEEIHSGSEWFHAQQPERISISSYDGLNLVGWFLPAEHARGTLLLVHGYRSDHRSDFGIIYPFYAELGFNILTVDQRAHGESEGKYITFGIKERFDVRNWAIYLYDRFGPEHRIILDGISMGCTSVLMALGTELPGSVKGVIADCGFTSPYAQFCHMFREHYRLPRHPMMDIMEWYAKLFAGFGFRDYSTITALEQNTRPVLFVHGEADRFVPPRFTEENYAACRGEKTLFTVPGAKHGGSYILERSGAQAALKEFLQKVAP